LLVLHLYNPGTDEKRMYPPMSPDYLKPSKYPQFDCI